MKSKSKQKLINSIILVLLVYFFLGLCDFLWWHYYDADSYDMSGTIKRQLVPELFPADSEGDVAFKIRRGKVYYRWSVLGPFDIGVWPLIRKSESNNIPNPIRETQSDLLRPSRAFQEG